MRHSLAFLFQSASRIRPIYIDVINTSGHVITCCVFSPRQERRELSAEIVDTVCKAKRQYLLTLQVSRYCLLALQSSNMPAGITHILQSLCYFSTTPIFPRFQYRPIYFPSTCTLTLRFIGRLNHCYWERNVCLDTKDLQMFSHKLSKGQ